jgi:hypothetical protein
MFLRLAVNMPGRRQMRADRPEARSAGAVDMPLDHQTARQPPVGGAERTARRYLLFHAASRARIAWHVLIHSGFEIDDRLAFPSDERTWKQSAPMPNSLLFPLR